MKQGTVVDLDVSVAILAAKLGKEHRLAMADSVIYATCKKYEATLWTQDGHFKDLASVRYFAKTEPPRRDGHARPLALSRARREP